MVTVCMAVPWRLLGQKATIAYGGLRSVAGSGTQTPAKEAHGCHATFAAGDCLPLLPPPPLTPIQRRWDQRMGLALVAWRQDASVPSRKKGIQ